VPKVPSRSWNTSSFSPICPCLRDPGLPSWGSSSQPVWAWGPLHNSGVSSRLGRGSQAQNSLGLLAPGGKASAAGGRLMGWWAGVEKCLSRPIYACRCVSWLARAEERVPLWSAIPLPTTRAALRSLPALLRLARGLRAPPGTSQCIPKSQILVQYWNWISVNSQYWNWISVNSQVLNLGSIHQGRGGGTPQGVP
jgi:hypothetical protein